MVDVELSRASFGDVGGFEFHDLDGPLAAAGQGDLDLVAGTYRAVRLTGIPIDLQSAILAGRLGLRPALEYASHIEPDVEADGGCVGHAWILQELRVSGVTLSSTGCGRLCGGGHLDQEPAMLHNPQVEWSSASRIDLHEGATLDFRI